MSFVLSVEDSNGKDTNLEVDQTDDFATFLQKAEIKLGYTLHLSDITENKDVSLNDNVYQFFNNAEMETNEVKIEIVNDEEEYGDVEFLTEDGALENLNEFLTVKTNEGSQGEYQYTENEIKINYEEGKNDSDEYSQMEYLEEEESDEQDIVDLEILDPSLEDDLNNYDSKEAGGISQWKMTEMEEDFKNSFSELLKNENPELLDAERIKPYTKEDLLDMLGGSPERNDENTADFNIEGLSSEMKDDRIFSMLNRREPIYKRKQNFLKAKMDLKEKLLNLKKSKLHDKINKNKTRLLMKRERLKMKIKESLKKSKTNRIPQTNDPKLSSFDIAMLKRTIRQPYISVAKISENQVTSVTSTTGDPNVEKSEQDNDSLNFNLPLDDSRYLPSKYEDIDNEGVFDYMPDEFSQNTDFNDLLTIRKNKPIFSLKNDKKSLKNKERDDVLKAVGGINKMMGIHRKFSVIPAAAKKNRKNIRKINRSLLKGTFKSDDTEMDGHSSYLDSVVKSEPFDDEDDDYRPGKDIDWMKTKKTKEKYSCRMCSDNFPKLGLAISHALTHRIAGNPVFPCIICIYAFSTYVELQKHMKKEHQKRKYSKKSPLDALTPKIRNRPGRKPKFLGTHIEIIDGEEVCDVEMLEEWLDEDMEEDFIKKENSDNDYADVEYLIDDLDAFEDEIRQSIKMDYEDESVAEEEWLLEEDDGTPIFSFNNKEDEDSEFIIQEPKSKAKKNKCLICLNVFSSPEELTDHKCTGVKQKSRSTQGSHRCAFCGQLFVSRKRLLYHKTFHQIELLEMKLTCQQCPERKFSSELDLFDHINNEHNVDFVCEHTGCDKKFHLRSALRIHSRIHGKKCHECKICGRKFYDIHNLREHNITHLAIKPFQCHICLKFVNRRSRLKMHILSHEAKPVENYVLSCKHCSMAFKDAEEAEKHIEDSTECSNAILSTIDKSELLTAMSKFDERNDTKMMENIDLMDIEQSEKMKTESAVDDIVNETLAKNGIVDVPLMESDVVNQNLQNSEITDGDMKILLDEVGNVKMMFSSEENTNQYLEDKIYEVKCEDVETHSKSNDGLISEIGNGAVKELLGEVEVNIKPLQESEYGKDSSKNTCDNYLIDPDMLQVESISENKNMIDMNDVTTIIQTNEIDNNYIDSIDVKDQNYASEQDGVEIKQKKQKEITAEELLGQLKEVSQTFIEAIKTKMVFRCEYCEKAFNTKEALNKHKKCHEGLRNPFICNICNAAFSSFARRTSHKTTHGFFRSQLENEKEKGAVENNDDKFPVLRYYVCQHCNKTFLHWSYLRVHRRQKHGKFTYYFNCRVCGEKFTDSWSLNSHRRKLHAETINSKKASNSSYRCEDCGEGFNKRILFAKHRLDQHADPSLIRLKNKSGSFSCTLCHKVYQTKIGLEGHLRTHNGGVFLCDLCGNGFALLSGLENHNKRVHLKEVRYSCNECGRNLFSPGELESHKRCHTGEKPFPCEYCNLSFRTKGSRNEHYRIHTNERPYPCDLCDQSFKRSNAMKNHRLTHTGERRYSCPHCPKLFHVHSNLKSHIKMKHPDQYMLSEIKGNQIDTFHNKTNEIRNNPHMNITINDPTQMVVVEDVVIEDESGNTLKQERLSDLVEYKYTSEDITSHIEYNENNAEYDSSKDAKIQIQLVDESNSGHRLLYTVGEESAAETDIHLIGGEVRYALVDEIGDEQQHQQYAIIDSDQFSKEVGEQNSLYYT